MTETFDLHHGLGYKLTIAARTNNASFETDLAELGLSRQAWCVLVAVGEQNINTPSSIAQYIGIIRAAASRTLKQMEKSSLLQREQATGDKRSTTVVLTQKGHELLKKSLPLARANRQSIETILTQTERDQLTALLEKITQSASTTASGV